ncbi:MAG: hypothetical protein QNJ12_21440 [Ilumatobacter sp.]|uniref:hypothetical protein n=1 Tax=Ilumatobacter sp. TaxID=1967498 RepID=UPI00260C3FF0|nr:hypothetical protein [Ilumatobacter sp.]MDJ0771364.1 hypothetical protein [Ilumatobacter sp.]
MKSLDVALADVHRNADSTAFVICYAADCDMGGGMRPFVGRYRSLEHFHDTLEAAVEQAHIDILLTSVSAMDVLARDRQLFTGSPVTPAVRANDTTDIWKARGGNYLAERSRPFASTTVREAMYGTLTPTLGQVPDVDLGLWSITFNNDIDADERSLERFRQFRQEAADEGFRYFVEVFNPNAPNPIDGPVADYVNDCITRMFAGVPRATQPQFLKVAYNGPQALEDLVAYTPLVVGVLGGPASTAHDTFKLVSEVKQHGGRVALLGRRIREADDPLAMIELLRHVADGAVEPDDATREYHGRLGAQGITPSRSLEDDLVIETPELLGT